MLSYMNVLDVAYIKKLAHLALGHWVISLGDALIAHPEYQTDGSIPHPLRDGHGLKDLGTNFLTVHAAAETKHVDRVAERDTMRPLVELHSVSTAHWTVMRSALENNPNLTANLPLPMKKKSTKSSGANPITPQNPRAKHGGPTVAIISTDKVDKARTYEVGICLGEISQESSWWTVGPFDHCRKIEITGLEPGKLYYFRVRCFVGGVMSPWSEIVSLRVL